MKSELKENMYVRTEKGIAKIKKIFPDGSEPYFEAKYETDTYLEIYYDSEYVSEYDVLKASYNIIDILEIGDIISFYEDIDNYKKQYVIGMPDLITLDEIKDKITNDNIRLVSILTKEQFEQMAYKVGE